jgi:hypothetical protein
MLVRAGSARDVAGRHEECAQQQAKLQLKRQGSRNGRSKFVHPVAFRRLDRVGRSPERLPSSGRVTQLQTFHFDLNDSSVVDAVPTGRGTPGDFAAWLQFISCNPLDTPEF